MLLGALGTVWSPDGACGPGPGGTFEPDQLRGELILTGMGCHFAWFVSGSVGRPLMGLYQIRDVVLLIAVLFGFGF